LSDRTDLLTERLVWRRIGAEDAALMLAIWNDPAFGKHVGDRGIRTVEHGYGPFSMNLKDGGGQIGICGLFKRDNLDAPDIGFAVLPAYCGKGYAAEAALAVVGHARDDLGIEVLTAIVSPANVPSVGLIEKLGLTFERMITMPGDDQAISLYSMRLRA